MSKCVLNNNADNGTFATHFVWNNLVALTLYIFLLIDRPIVHKKVKGEVPLCKLQHWPVSPLLCEVDTTQVLQLSRHH